MFLILDSGVFFWEIHLGIDEAKNPTSESHDSIARMNYLRKRKKEKT